MSESVEIPDAAASAATEAVVAAAEAKKRFEEDTWVEGFAGDFARAALVAARPYLMPTREEIEQRIRRVYINGGAHIVVAQEAAADIATEIMALLNGEIKKGEDR